MPIKSLIAEAQAALSKSLNLTSHEARFEARLLIQTALGVNHAWLLSHENDALEANIHAAFQVLLDRRLAGEPIAYILGKREFYGLELKVTPATLIPRPDTETLVEAALAKIPQHDAFSVLDLGTGTGAIALAIAKERPHAQVTAVDASEMALNVAIENSRTLHIPNTKFMISNWFSALENQTFDLIVSNPPYIEDADEHLKQGDLRFEPRTALASGKDGLDDIRQIVQAAPQHLKVGGWLMLEHGYNQAESVASLLRDIGFSHISHALDLAGISRITMGCL